MEQSKFYSEFNCPYRDKLPGRVSENPDNCILKSVLSGIKSHKSLGDTKEKKKSKKLFNFKESKSSVNSILYSINKVIPWWQSLAVNFFFLSSIPISHAIINRHPLDETLKI